MTKHGRSGHATRSPRSVSCRSSKHRRTIARPALGSRPRNSPSKSYSIPGSQHEPDELSLRECQRNIELVWLTGRLMPDFKTIADFRKDNGEAIRRVCREFVVLCRRLELFAAGPSSIHSYDEVVDGIDALPDENTQARRSRNGATRPGLQHGKGHQHSGRW